MNIPRIRKLGVMGGTFDPIHIGHLVVASQAFHELELDSVMFIPAGRPWQRPGFSPAEDRFAMTSLAAELHPGFSVSRMEIDRRGPTYTADTLETLHEFYGAGLEVFLLLGSDAAALVPTWNRSDRVTELSTIVVAQRPGHGLPLGVRVLHGPELAVSASDVRARVREGRPIDFLVPAAVARYIAERGLYQGAWEAADA
jgi:nicotinate-nucleotide adenylyltransferase